MNKVTIQIRQGEEEKIILGPIIDFLKLNRWDQNAPVWLRGWAYGCYNGFTATQMGIKDELLQ